MRVSRQWRDLILRKRFGHGYDQDASPSKAGLALFCPACPQPGINTPKDWQSQPKYVSLDISDASWYFPYLFDRWLYRRNIVVDSNFSLEHMRMKKSEDDVFLSDGEGYMVQWTPYAKHLETSLETKLVCLA
jgi:hypothetical protein